MLTREEARAAIRDVCKKRGLQYTLDFCTSFLTKMRISYVKPENLLDYRYSLVAGNRAMIDAQYVVEEEVVLEIWQEGNKWGHKIAQTKALRTGDSVIGDIETDITDALSKTDWKNAYRMIPDKDQDRMLVQMWNKGSDRNAISERLGYMPKTVTKKIRQLRKEYPDYVMMHTQRTRLGIRPRVMPR